MRSFLLLYSESSSGGGGAEAYKFYKFLDIQWIDGDAAAKSVSEICFYDNADNIEGLGIGNGQLNIDPTTGSMTGPPGHYQTFSPAKATTGVAAYPDRMDYLGAAGAVTWLQFEFTTTPINAVVTYTIYSGNSVGKMMKTWTLNGSQDGLEWTELDSRTNITPVAGTYQPNNYVLGE